MNTTNPSTEAREAAQKICDMAKRAGFPIPGIVDVTGIIQSALDSALTASAARAKELEDALRPFALLGGNVDGICNAYHDLRHDVVVYENSGKFITAGDVRSARAALSIKVGETK